MPSLAKGMCCFEQKTEQLLKRLAENENILLEVLFIVVDTLKQNKSALLLPQNG